MSEKGEEAQRFMQTGGFVGEGRGAPEAKIKRKPEPVADTGAESLEVETGAVTEVRQLSIGKRKRPTR